MAKVANLAVESFPGVGEPGERNFVGWQKRRADFFGKKKGFNGEESMTEQSHKASCDLNALLLRYEETREIPRQDGQLFWGDFSNVPDMFEARKRVAEAEFSFGQLPARIRSKFDNDPAKLIQFVQDPKNFGDAVDLGLIDVSASQRLEDQWETVKSERAAAAKAAESAAAQASSAPPAVTPSGSAPPSDKKV